MKTKVLITGATGFIGKYLTNYLLKKNYSVRALVRDVKQPFIFNKSVEIFSGDLTKPESLADICNDIETVFHLGGYAHADKKNVAEFSAKHNAINYLGTKHILDQAKHQVKNFVYFSSVKAVADSELFINEGWNQKPNSPYGIAKRQAEKLVFAIGEQANMHTTILRPALVYGPSCKGNLANMLRAIDKGFILPFPKTNNKRSMVSVMDVCQAAVLAAYHPNANRKIYFVTDGIDYSTRELYELICMALGKSIPKWRVPMPIFKVLAYSGDILERILGRSMPFNSDAMHKLFASACYNSQQIQADLDFKPIYTFKKMLPDIVAVYKSNE